MGDNVLKPGEARAAFAALDRLHNEKEEMNAAKMADIKVAYETHAGKLGVSRKILRTAYQKHRAEEKFQAQMAELKRDEKDAFDIIAASFGDGTPFGRWAQAQAGTIPLEDIAATDVGRPG